jgi:hypothetical protein
MSEKTVISWQTHTRGGIRILVALLLALGAVVSVSVATQHTAQAATTGCLYQVSNGDYHIRAGCSNVQIKNAHRCLLVAWSTNHATEGTECIDIYATNTDPSDGEVWGVGTFYCQGTNPRCLGMNVKVGMSAKPQIIALTVGGSYGCNSATCPAASGKAWVGTSHISGMNCFKTYAWDVKGDVIYANGARSASHAPKELDTPNIGVCFD